MHLFTSIDGYCERHGTNFFAEPINLFTNLAFIIVAFFMWQRCNGNLRAQVLVYLLATIGVGSALLHSFAQTWAALVDITAILIFVLYYLYLANRTFRENSFWVSLIGVSLFFPYTWLMISIFSQLNWLDTSAAYIPIALLIGFYALDLRKRKPKVAIGLFIGCMMLLTSIGFRALDLKICESFSLGTHFVWHLINALMLGWMIEVYLRHENRKIHPVK